ncbi:hypothetical protein [Lacisediminihabitans profunda]|nr:hypothetical protein [Lacisediminihabitans profunda]
MRRSGVGTAIVALAVLALSACTWSAQTPTPPASPSVSSASPGPSLTPTPTASLACDTLVTPTALSRLTSGGSVFTEGFATRMREEGNELAAFLDLGGILCQWGYPESDASVVLGYSPITAAQAMAQKQRLTAEGWVAKVAPDGSESWTTTNTEKYLGNEPVYVFRPGNWRFALDGSALADFAL